MSPLRRRGLDPEQRRRQARAEELLLAVAARLVGSARLTGGFPDAAGVAAFAAALAPELEPDEHIVPPGKGWVDLPRGDYKVVLGEPERESIPCRCSYGSQSDFGRLRIDGAFEERGSGFGVSLDDPEHRVELSPLEQEVMRRVSEARREEGRAGRPRFGGREFLRAIAVDPQPGATAQVLAVELYGDGLVVRFTYDDPIDVFSPVPLHYYELAGVEPPLEELLAEAEAEGGNLEPNLSVRDDLDTRYLWAGSGRGGVEVAHGEACFVPAVPAAATRLIVSSYAGAVEIDL